MSDYDSGDDLFEGVNIDRLTTSTQPTKRNRAESGATASLPAKRPKSDIESKVEDIALNILRTKFMYNSFRHEQAQAIAATLRGENVLVIFPTGAGKSLCYQVCSDHLFSPHNAPQGPR